MPKIGILNYSLKCFINKANKCKKDNLNKPKVVNKEYWWDGASIFFICYFRIKSSKKGGKYDQGRKYF